MRIESPTVTFTVKYDITFLRDINAILDNMFFFPGATYKYNALIESDIL